MRDQLNIFHNTTNLEGTELKVAVEKAKSQDEEVLAIFKQFPGTVKMTPELVLNYLQNIDPIKYQKVPLTSIRRAFSNLQKQGEIIKTGNTTKGSFGRDVHCWKVCK